VYLGQENGQIYLSELELTHWDDGSADLSRMLRDSDHSILSLRRFVMTRKQSIFFKASRYYLSQTHRWLPIVSKVEIDYIFERLEPIPDPCISCLLLSMASLSRQDRNKSPNLADLFYTAAKMIYFQAQSEVPSVTLVQAGLLLAINEYGRGTLSRAYSTITNCRSIAQLLHIFPENSYLDEASEQSSKLYWNIVLMERLICLELNFPVVPLSAVQRSLELESSWADRSSHEGSGRSNHLSNIQAVILLDQVLETVQTSGNQRKCDLDDLDLELLRFLAVTYEEEAKNPGSRCQSIAIGIL
jgi:hypothetical protein